MGLAGESPSSAALAPSVCIEKAGRETSAPDQPFWRAVLLVPAAFGFQHKTHRPIRLTFPFSVLNLCNGADLCSRDGQAPGREPGGVPLAAKEGDRHHRIIPRRGFPAPPDRAFHAPPDASQQGPPPSPAPRSAFALQGAFDSPRVVNRRQQPWKNTAHAPALFCLCGHRSGRSTTRMIPPSGRRGMMLRLQSSAGRSATRGPTTPSMRMTRSSKLPATTIPFP